MRSPNREKDLFGGFPGRFSKRGSPGHSTGVGSRRKGEGMEGSSVELELGGKGEGEQPLIEEKDIVLVRRSTRWAGGGDGVLGGVWCPGRREGGSRRRTAEGVSRSRRQAGRVSREGKKTQIWAFLF